MCIFAELLGKRNSDGNDEVAAKKEKTEDHEGDGSVLFCSSFLSCCL